MVRACHLDVSGGAGWWAGATAPEPAIAEAAALIEAGERGEAARILNDFLVGRPWDAGAFHQVGAMWLVAGEPELARPAP